MLCDGGGGVCHENNVTVHKSESSLIRLDLPYLKYNHK